MAEIYAILVVATKAIELRGNLLNNKKKSESLIKCLQAVKAPLQAIDDAERDRIQVSHEETLALLKEVIDRAHALLQKQTSAQNYVLKAVRSANVRDQFHEIQIALQAHLQTLNLSVGVLSGVKMQESLKIIEQVNGEALKEHLDELRENQNIMQGNQRDILENQSTTHDNQRDILSRAEVALRNQDEMKSNQDEIKSMLAAIVQNQLNVSGNVGNTYITNDHSTTTTNNINNVTNNYQDQRSNVSDSDYSRTTKPRKPEPYVKRKTKLHIAAEKGSFSEVEVALRECFIDHETPTGSTALLLAVENNHVEVVKELLSAECFIDHETPDGSTALLLVVKNNHVEVVKELLSAGVDFTVEANQKAWMEVFEREQSESPEREHLIPHFAGAGADIKSLSDRSPCILLLAVENKYTEVIKELLLIGVDFTVEANQKAWMHVIEKKDVHLIPHFADGGVDVNAKKDGETPLHLSAQDGHLDISKFLIDAGADERQERRWLDPLHRSAGRGRHEVARALIEAGADVNAKNVGGWTPLHNSAFIGHLEVARALIEAELT